MLSVIEKSLLTTTQNASKEGSSREPFSGAFAFLLDLGKDKIRSKPKCLGYLIRFLKSISNASNRFDQIGLIIEFFTQRSNMNINRSL